MFLVEDVKSYQINLVSYILWLHSNVFTEFLHSFWSNHIITPYLHKLQTQFTYIYIGPKRYLDT